MLDPLTGGQTVSNVYRAPESRPQEVVESESRANGERTAPSEGQREGGKLAEGRHRLARPMRLAPGPSKTVPPRCQGSLREQRRNRRIVCPRWSQPASTLDIGIRVKADHLCTMKVTESIFDLTAFSDRSERAGRIQLSDRRDSENLCRATAMAGRARGGASNAFEQAGFYELEPRTVAGSDAWALGNRAPSTGDAHHHQRIPAQSP